MYKAIISQTRHYLETQRSVGCHDVVWGLVSDNGRYCDGIWCHSPKYPGISCYDIIMTSPKECVEANWALCLV